jgi:hypothetical protein
VSFLRLGDLFKDDIMLSFCHDARFFASKQADERIRSTWYLPALY